MNGLLLTHTCGPSQHRNPRKPHSPVSTLYYTILSHTLLCCGLLSQSALERCARGTVNLTTAEGVFELVMQVRFSHFQYFQLSTCQKISANSNNTSTHIHIMASTASASSSSKKAGGALEFPAIEDEASNLVARVAASALEGKAYQQKKVPRRHRHHCKAPNHLTCACVCACVYVCVQAKTWSGQISETAVRELRALSEVCP